MPQKSLCLSLRRASPTRSSIKSQGTRKSVRTINLLERRPHDNSRCSPTFVCIVRGRSVSSVLSGFLLYLLQRYQPTMRSTAPSQFHARVRGVSRSGPQLFEAISRLSLLAPSLLCTITRSGTIMPRRRIMRTYVNTRRDPCQSLPHLYIYIHRIVP